MSIPEQPGKPRPYGNVVDVDGTGWTGVTNDEKRTAGGRAELGADKYARMFCASHNAEEVAAKRGTGYWTGRGGDGGGGK